MKKMNPKFKRVLLIVITIIVFIAIYFAVIGIYKYEKAYQKRVQEEAEREAYLAENEKLYDLKDYPKVDASLATQPLANAFIKNFTGEEEINEEDLDYSNTHPGYVKLINDEVDLIIVTEPSEEELALAKENGVELEVIPVVKEGFVFYVNSENKVSNLTVDQIQRIYTGEITNWKQLGGKDEEIIAYQRPTNSGSQTGMLSLVMKGLDLMPAPKEKLVDTMFEIVNLVSNYKNGGNAIGYSYYYYATTMFQTIDKEIAEGIKMLAINGVEPNNETIKEDLYPFKTAYYIVINKADKETDKSRILANQMLSERGQRVAEEAGYVPVK